MNLWNKVRLKYFIATHTIDYTYDYLQHIYKIYLNHSKIIHIRDGHPVYSLSTPALFSKPAAHFFARSTFRGIQNKNIPNMMSFAVNDICNATCKHCSFFSGVDDKKKKVLSRDEALQAISDAQELGISVINFVGGEPLLRTDLPELIASVDKTRTTPIMFTNGWLLAEKAHVLRSAGLDGVYISIDAPIAQDHDRLRGRPGLFNRAFEGIEVAKREGMSVGMSCCITPESFKKGSFDKLIELAKERGIHEVLVFDAMPTGRYKHRKDLVDNNEWVEDMIAKSRKYNNDDSYPGILIWAYVTSHRSVGCSCGTSYFYLSPYGDVMSCDFNHAIFGSIREKPLYQIWDRLSSMPDFCSAKWGGCKIKDSACRNKSTVKGISGCC